ncbi:hypothetical protein APU01nite_13560 [Alkalibacterium putridalgicola]|uniref:Uncharacterized protein n=1 Tax=Alkalibacterium putridalgicola TaxID=426703 RepID=A0ABQ0UXZ3_9LACT|nr:hypothetical protein APU01nite_13560 [Alkalibacterium putridalgicola]
MTWSDFKCPQMAEVSHVDRLSSLKKEVNFPASCLESHPLNQGRERATFFVKCRSVYVKIRE